MSLTIIWERHRRLSHDDYSALEQTKDRRFEYWAAEVFAMTGGSESHALISMNIGAVPVAAMRNQSCRVYGTDVKLRIEALDKFYHPDAMVQCE